MGSKYDKVGGGNFGVYKKRKESNVIGRVVGIIVTLIILGAIV